MSDAANVMGEQVLTALGLDPMGVQVYLTMHTTPGMDSTELAERLHLDESTVLDALDNLAELSLLRVARERSGGLVAVSLERALQTLLRKQSEQLSARTESLAVLQSAMRDLLASPQGRRVALGKADVEAVTGLERVQACIDELTARAAESLYTILPGGPQPREALEAARGFDEELARRGLALRALQQNTVRADKRNLEYARWLIELGVEVRTAAVVPPRLILIDQSIALVSLDPQQTSAGVLVIREPGIITPLIELFEVSWSAAQPVDFADAKPEDGELSSQESALLQLLAAGSTDEAAAKKLGVSVRTVRRIMADLMDRLGAASRFEAGHRATQQGWL